MDLDTLLWDAVDRGASDLHLRAGSPPMLRVDGEIEPVDGEASLTAADTSALAKEILQDHQINFESMREIDVGHAVRELGRFRVNIFTNSGQIGIVLRIMPPEPLGLEELNLPPVLSKVAEAKSRPRAGDRSDWERQVDDVGGDDRPHQLQSTPPHNHD